MTLIQYCENELDIKKNAVIDWNNYLREVCAFTLINNSVVIGGAGTTAEIDESLFTGKKNQVG